jgi:hypothetical protein
MTRCWRVAVVEWWPEDAIAAAIGEALFRLGHQPIFFSYDGRIPTDVDIVLTFAPYGQWLYIPETLAGTAKGQRPILIHWNFESIPNPTLPRLLVDFVSSWRSRLGRLDNTLSTRGHQLTIKSPLALITRRMHKYRYVGDYHYAFRMGWLDLFLETSQVYTEYHCRNGLPALFVPWGTSTGWYADLGLERDIDVLWMGKRRTKRRSRLLDQLRRELSELGIQMHVVDGIERPFIYGEERTRVLNRTKVALNLLPTWWDNTLAFRFNMAAGNRSMVISEPVLQHCPAYEAGKHYVSTPTEQLTKTILHYLTHEGERFQIAQNAYTLATTNLTLESSIRRIIELVASGVDRHEPRGQGLRRGAQRD